MNEKQRKLAVIDKLNKLDLMVLQETDQYTGEAAVEYDDIHEAVQEILDLINDFTPKRKWEVGDRVRNDESKRYRYDDGTIAAIEKSYMIIEWDKWGRHNPEKLREIVYNYDDLELVCPAAI